MNDPSPDLRAEWERGVALGSRGRYADAWSVLTAVMTRAGQPAGAGDDTSAPGSRQECPQSLAFSAAASLHRQLSRHGAARELDTRALMILGIDPALTDPAPTDPVLTDPVLTDPDRAEAALDATLGLAADAIGHADADLATAWLDRAEQILAGSPEPRPWRAPIRLHWVRAELALLGDRPDHAEGAAATAVTLAERAASARHLAKSRLIHSVARVVTDPIAAAAGLRSSLSLSVPAGWRPLQWPAYLVLADLEADPRYLSAAGLVIRSIAADTPAPIAQEWLERPEVRRCLAVPDL